MSDTPRTDYEIKVNQLDRFEADWPRKLERECDQLAKQCVKNVEECDELRAALVISEKKEMATRAVIEKWKQDEGADAKRLEFLIERNEAAFYFRGSRYGITREEIDEAIEESNHE